jgi:hypothetical protein
VRRLTSRLALGLVALAVTLGGAELALRALGIATPVAVPPLELPGGMPRTRT